jgi:hypothetical protein
MSLTLKQKQEIEDEFVSAWNEMYNTVLTKEQQENPETMQDIAFEVETILERIAAQFGLSGMNDV